MFLIFGDAVRVLRLLRVPNSLYSGNNFTRKAEMIQTF